MPTIHPSSIIEGDVQLADDVVIGPWCVVTGTVRIGAGSRLMAQNHITGRTDIGEKNTFWPGAIIGGAPQDINFDHTCEEPGLVIGDRNMFREGVTVHRGKTTEPTRIGNDNYFMTNSHVGHDSVLGDNIQIATGSMLGGHSTIGDRVIIGGAAAVHQFCRIDEGAMISGCSGVSLDVPAWFIVTGISICSSLNLIGMRRHGMSTDEIQSRRWVYKTLFRQHHSGSVALDLLRAKSDDPVVAGYIKFIEASDRGICRGPKRKHIRSGS
jgi:UDP-N-acetylglucosamine acyltransferase